MPALRGAFAWYRVSVESRLLGHGKAVIKYTGFEKQHRIMGSRLSDFSALELSGAKDVAVRFTTPIEAGRGYSELSITWS